MAGISAKYTDQQILEVLRHPYSKKGTEFITRACQSFWNESTIQLARTIMDTWGMDVPNATIAEERHYFLNAGYFFQQFKFPLVPDQRNCAAYQGLKDALKQKKSQLLQDRVIKYNAVQWVDIELSVCTRMISDLDVMYSGLSCDVYLLNQQQQNQVNILQNATDKALSNDTGNGVDYTKWAIIAIIVIVAIVVIKKLFSNG